jgi:spermidine synthase
MMGIGEAFWASFILLLPFCLISGFLLALYSGLASPRRGPEQIGDVYVLDTLGGIIGGLLFGLLLVYFFAPFQIATFLLVLNLGAALYLSHVTGRPVMRGSALVVLLISLVVLGRTDLERQTGQALFPGLDVIFQKSTPYGNLAVTRQEGQLSFYQNGVPIGSSQDHAAAEETVHYALVQHPDPRDVLLVSGGLVGAQREVGKYPVTQIDYVELDPAILELAQSTAGAGNDPRLHPIAADARRHIRSARGAYDAILMALPDPASAQLNRFYTLEFFSEVRRALRPNGVLSFSLSSAENYANPQVRLLASAVHRSLSSVFANILMIPGARQYFVASDRPLDYDIAARLEKRGIETRYVRTEYLAAKLTPDRLAAARKMVAARADPNRDFRPGSYYAHLRYWLSQFGSGMLFPALLVAALLILVGGLLAGAPRRPVSAALCASGFAGMGLGVVLLIAFQVCYGYVYQQVGLIITGFMVGAAVGAAWSVRSGVDASRLMFRLDALLAVAAFLLVPLLLGLRASESSFLQTVSPPLIFPLLNGIVGFLAGAQFPPAAKLSFRGVEETAGNLYAVDLLGACLGALLVSAFCVPLVGIAATCALLGGIKIMTAIALRVRREAPAPVASVRPALTTHAWLSFGFVLLVFTAIGMAIVAEETSGGIYALSFHPLYYWGLVGLLALGIYRALEPQAFSSTAGRIGAAFRGWTRPLQEATRLPPSRWLYFLAFSLVAFYPIFRCYFKVPYLFCHVCPQKCVFGFVRPYLIPAVLIMNLEKRYWCYRACPVGTLFDCQARACKKSKRVPKWLQALPIAVLVFTAIAYFKIMWDLEGQPAVEFDWYTFFFHNMFAVTASVIAIAAALILLAYRLRRTFCETLCPVGTFSDLVLKLERFFSRKRMSAGPTPASTQPQVMERRR